MPSFDELRRENQLLQDRISKLSEASLRISDSLDVSTVLHEVVERACALTCARYGGIAIMDDFGQCEQFITSGFTAAEYQRMIDWADGPRLFEHFRNVPGVLRGPDMDSYLQSHGFSTDLFPSNSFHGTPMHHRGSYIGHFFVAIKKNGSEFTSEDEEVLLMFAAQAATAIANARAFRDEQRARADLEALVDTSPTGVAVFDAKTGETVLANPEITRLLGSLCTPDLPPEKLGEVLTITRADGSEISLAEISVPEALSAATNVRAEQIVLKTPDGRTLTTLVNTTPIRAEDGTVESAVITMQDLAPLQELERMRAEFLGMVSHELRAPLTSIKGSTTTVLSALPTPNPAEVLQIIRIIDEQADHMRSLINDLLDAGHIETGTLSVSPEPSEVASLVDQARNTFLSAGGRHTVRIDLPLELPRVMADRQRIVQVINNLLSNAARYSPESAPIRIAAVHEGVHVAVSISDEGRGVPPDLLPHLFRKHVRLGDDRGIRGSGLGLAICKGLVEAHGGRIWAESAGTGLGARFTFTIPVVDAAGIGAAADFVGSSSQSRRMDREEIRILVVDDDPQTLQYVREALPTAGYSPVVTGNPRDVPRLIQEKQPRLVLLDLVLPGTDGIELMQAIPAMADLPVIFISGYGRDETIARALELGAADYIVKPFSTTELTARVGAALRGRAGPSKPFRLGDLSIHYEERRVTLADRPVQLTTTEYELLRVLSVNAGRVTRYDSLLRQVWGRHGSRDVRPLRAFIKMLRRKLGDDASNPTYIFTERRIGYRMPAPSDPRG